MIDLRRPLSLKIEPDAEGWYVVSADRFLVHGDGPSIIAAVADYFESLGEYYELVAASAQLGDLYDQQELARLKKHVRVTDD